MGAPVQLGAACLLLLLLISGAVAGLNTDRVEPAADEKGAPEGTDLRQQTEELRQQTGELRQETGDSEVMQKRFVFGSPAANSLTVSTDISFISE